jgi:hypothetical protein
MCYTRTRRIGMRARGASPPIQDGNDGHPLARVRPAGKLDRHVVASGLCPEICNSGHRPDTTFLALSCPLVLLRFASFVLIRVGNLHPKTQPLAPPGNRIEPHCALLGKFFSGGQRIDTPSLTKSGSRGGTRPHAHPTRESNCSPPTGRRSAASLPTFAVQSRSTQLY